jgi:HPt (histidine-containing phosphotransfer) domain-containing protein
MTDNSKSIQNQLAELRQQYAANLPGKIQLIEATWEKCLQDPRNEHLWKQMSADCHKLAGSGSSYGYPAVSQIARSLEHFCLKVIENECQIGAEQYQEIQDLLNKLKHSSIPSKESG